MGLVELEKKDYAKAIERFNEAVSLSPYEVGLEPFTNDQSIFAEPLAAAYYASGNKEKAREEYEKILTMAMGKLYYGDIFARSLYWLGKISEEKGLKSKAVEYYERFLTLWKDAGPGVPEVGDARKRMAALLAK